MAPIAEQAIANLRRAGAPAPAVGSSRPNELMYLPRVVRRHTFESVKRLDLVSQSIADRWAATSPERVRRLDDSNQLLRRVAAQAKLEAAALSDARAAGQNSDVPDSDLLELAGVDLDQHLFA